MTERPYIPRSGANLPATTRRPGDWRGDLRIWWREIDRVLLALILLLMAFGTAAVFAASPASAHRLSTHSVKLPELYFYWAHLRWQALGLIVLFGCLDAQPRQRAACRDRARRGDARASCCWCRWSAAR